MLSYTIRSFYQAYWSQGDKAPPAGDPTTEERKLLLALSLQRFVLASGCDPANCRVLDAGCGNGEFSGFMRGLGFAVVGVDIAKSALDMARRSWPEIGLCAASLEGELPFREGMFSAAWNTEVLEHLFDIHGCLCELNRVLRKGGILILTTPFHGFLKNLAITLVGFERHFNPNVSHIRFFTRKSLCDCLTRAGFEPLLWKGIGRAWPLYKSDFVVSRKVSFPGPPPEIIG